MQTVFDFSTSFALIYPRFTHGFQYFFLVFFPRRFNQFDVLTQLYFANLFPTFFSNQNPTSYRKAQNCRVLTFSLLNLKPSYSVLSDEMVVM